jgi:hypothetical protein
LSSEHRQLPQILHGSRQQKFIVRATESAQSQSVKTQDAFEVRKQHLDFLTVVA